MMLTWPSHHALARAASKSWHTTLWLCFLEARPAVQVIFLARFVAGAALASGSSRIIDLRWTLVGALSWMAATLCSYLFNGVTDIAEDRINGSRRPIAAGDLDPKTAVMVAYALAAVAVVGGFAVGPINGLLVVVFLGYGYAYSGRPFCLKQATGGTVAAVLVAGLTTYAAGFASVPPVRSHGVELVIFGAVMSLWMGLVGAIAKDFSDLKGDRAAGRRTALLCWGEGVARIVVAIAALALGGGFVLVSARWYPPLLPAALPLLAGGVIVAVLALVRTWSSGGRAARRRPYRVFMATQYCAHSCLLGTTWL